MEARNLSDDLPDDRRVGDQLRRIIDELPGKLLRWPHRMARDRA